MSNVFYPLSGFEDLPVTLIENSVQDAFEDGSASSRLLWSAQNFKRRFTVRHMPLTAAEFAWLRRFFSARSGRYDSFWFRDNVNRGGNALVRLSDKFTWNRKGLLYLPQVTLDEVAPIRILPDVDDVNAIMGASSALNWYDANRVLAYQHAGTPYWEPSGFIYDTVQNLPLAVYALGNNWSGFTNQYATFSNLCYGGTVFKSAANWPAGPAGICTVFVILQTQGQASQSIVTMAGALGTGKAVGIQLNYPAVYKPFLGGSETWTGVSVTDTNYHSIACTFSNTAGTVTAVMYKDGAQTAAGSNSQAWSAGPLCIGADPGGSLGGGIFNTNIAHVIYCFGAASQAQIKALHNLFAYQYGMPTV